MLFHRDAVIIIKNRIGYMDINFKKSGKEPRILVIEGEELLGEAICCGLRHYYCNVDWVKTDLAAWPLLLAKRFDVIILDLDLLGVLGEELLKNIRSKNIITPVIIMNNCSSGYSLAKSLGIGADDYISKPFNLDDLCEHICTLKKRRAFCVRPTGTVDDNRPSFKFN